MAQHHPREMVTSTELPIDNLRCADRTCEVGVCRLRTSATEKTECNIFAETVTSQGLPSLLWRLTAPSMHRYEGSSNFACTTIPT